MPITTRIDAAKDLTTFTVTGILSFDEVMPSVKAFYACKPTRYVLWDLQAVTDVQLASKQVEEVASFQSSDEGKRKSGKTACVVQGPFLHEIATMFSLDNNALQAPQLVMVFGHTEDAYQWFDEP